VQAHELLDEAGKQEVMGGAEGPQRRRATLPRPRVMDDLGGVTSRREGPLGQGLQEPSGLGELETAAGAHEERHTELALEVRDLLGDAWPCQARQRHLPRAGPHPDERRRRRRIRRHHPDPSPRGT
jgi:hypothetical protein